ncbi:MAG: glycosyl hydrolase family 17 protein [Saprospiraceae bacterium]|nr:glycosyl hydrolase family 17 protein [Saprospiraceae bacterium]
MKKRVKNISDYRKVISIVFICIVLICISSCESKKVVNNSSSITAKEILGNPEYQAISYGGYRHSTREKQPTIEELKEDMRILSAMGIKLLRTYNVQLAHTSNLLKAIESLKVEDPSFEMYVMLGAWIDCKNAWTELPPDHDVESEANASEIDRAVSLANQHKDIVKIIAVGNEAMVKWATSYYVQPNVILKWVNRLQKLKKDGLLPADLWITSSDNFASWGGGGDEYHVPALDSLIKAVDFISMHTYPMHDTHHNPEFWLNASAKEGTSKSDKDEVDAAMNRAKVYAQNQYQSVVKYVERLSVDKPIHIGETGWASFSDGFYGPEGARACDEYKQAVYYKDMRAWTNKAGISCFFFEAFDESWKDANNVNGSENHFGLFTVYGKAKYAIWDLVDNGVFEGLKRNNNSITKTFEGDKNAVMETSLNPLETVELENN